MRMKQLHIILLLLIAIIGNVGANPTSDELMVYLDSAYALATEGKVQEAIQVNEDALAMIPEDSVEQKCEFWSCLTICYHRIADYEKALYYGELCLAYDETQDNKVFLSSSLGNLAGIYGTVERYDIAEQYLLRAIDLEKAQLREDTSYTEKNLAIRQAMLGEVLLSKAKKMPRNEQEPYLTQALELTQNALLIEQKLGNKQKEGIRLSQLANIYNQMGDSAQGFRLNTEALEIARETGNRNTEVITLIQLERFEEAAAIAHELDMKNLELTACRQIAKEAKQEKNYKKEAEMLERVLELREIITTEESERQLTREQVHYQTEQKERQIKEQEKTIKEQELRQNILISAAVGIFIILILVIIVARNINLRKKAVEELAQQKEQSYGIISHDLRSPMVAQLQVLRMLYSNFDNYSRDEIRKYIHQIQAVSISQVELLNNLYAITVLSLDSKKVQQSHFDINGLISDMRLAMQNVADIKDITLDFKTQRMLVIANREDVQTIIRNLVSNAVKFSYEGGIVEIGTLQPDSFYIRDFGIGMSEERINEIMNAKSSVLSNKDTLNERSTGWGLQLCKRLINQNNGKMEIESEPQKGTTIVITLPH